MAGDDAIRALREALKLSPDNIPLRRHLAETLLGLGRPEEAEAEFRAALPMAPDDSGLRVGLASAFAQQGKSSHALVIVEDLLKAADAPPRASLLYARLLLRTGESGDALAHYRRAVERDPTLADADLAERLGLQGTDEYDTLDADGESDPGRDPGSSVEIEATRVRQTWDGDAPTEAEMPVERPILSFKDVGGMEGLKDEIRMKIIHPLSHPELYRAYGKTIGGGILLYGPPGCGKTYLARATAGEIHAGFLAVGINDVLDMWLGNSERNLHELFEQARRNAPCVLFFDEVDALAASRSDLKGGAGRQVVNQFLAETDGVQARNDGVLILAATNAPWHLDPAFRRPGRFDRILFVPPPDLPARAAILRLLCRGKPVQDVDFDHLAKKADGFSGADLKAVVDLAVEAKLREAMKAGQPRPLSTRDLATAATGLRPSTREWFATARNYALYSNQGGLYDDILKHLKL
jgi:AAA+ superfamily predicted ATPase/thioredoxin-like negative regulator of GroEL